MTPQREVIFCDVTSKQVMADFAFTLQQEEILAFNTASSSASFYRIFDRELEYKKDHPGMGTRPIQNLRNNGR